MKMTTQTPITNISAALARAQKKISVADKNAINKDHQSRFADMESVVGACRDALAAEEISILQPLGGSASELLVTTVLLHSSGEFLESEFRATTKDPHDTDSVKSLVTQMRRYSLMGMLCIATADDDGQAKPAKLPAKKGPVQEKGPVIESHDATQPEPADPVSTVETNDDWKAIVVHVGTDSSPYKGKTLGEIDAAGHKWLFEKVIATLGKTKKDRALAAAIVEATQGPELSLAAPEPHPEPDKAVEPPPNAKETAPSEPEPMEWRSIVAHNFKPDPKVTLGFLADSAMDAVAKGYDGTRILRGMKSEGIAKIQAKAQTTKDKILVNAILAANDELDLRDRVRDKFRGAGLDDQEAAEHLIANGVLESDETLFTVPAEMLAYLRDQWSEIEKTIKGAK